MGEHIESFKQFCSELEVSPSIELKDALKVAEDISLKLAITKTRINEEINRRSGNDLELNWKKLRDDLCPDAKNFGCARSGYILMDQRSPRSVSLATEELGTHWKVSPASSSAIKTRLKDIDIEIASLREKLSLNKNQL